MRGLFAIPTLRELQGAYNHLQSTQSLVDTDTLSLYSQWARLDPRFAEILVGHLRSHWDQIPLGRLIEALRVQPWPRAMAVLLRFVDLMVAPNERKALGHLVGAIEDAFPPPAPELFFIPLQGPSPVVLREELSFPSNPYSDVGYIGSQSLLSRARYPSNRTLLAPEERRRLLKELLARKRVVNVDDYIQACKGMVSRRQAQRDLRSYADVSPKGFTRGRIYKV